VALRLADLNFIHSGIYESFTEEFGCFSYILLVTTVGAYGRYPEPIKKFNKETILVLLNILFDHELFFGAPQIMI
jgi:hypothetical protein